MIETYWSIWSKIKDLKYVEHRKMPGWSGFLPFYKFKCPDHGVVEDYPHGYRQILRCQECMKNG